MVTTFMDRPVELADIERRAHAAITERLRLADAGAVLALVRDPDDATAAVLHADSGGNALACTQQLRAAGYQCTPLPRTASPMARDCVSSPATPPTPRSSAVP